MRATGHQACITQLGLSQSILHTHAPQIHKQTVGLFIHFFLSPSGSHIQLQAAVPPPEQ